MFSVPVTRLPEGFSEDQVALAAEVESQQQRGFQTDHAVATRWDYWNAESGSGRARASLDQLPGHRLQFVVSKDDDYESPPARAVHPGRA